MDKLCKVCGERAVIFFGGEGWYCRKHAISEGLETCFYCGERATAYVESNVLGGEFACCDKHLKDEEGRRVIEEEHRAMQDAIDGPSDWEE